MNNNELIIYSDPKSSMSEAIRTLRTNLQFASVDKGLGGVIPLNKILNPSIPDS